MCLEGGCQRDALGRGEGVGSIGGYLCVAILPGHEVIAGDGGGGDGHRRAGHGFSISSGDRTHGCVGGSYGDVVDVVDVDIGCEIARNYCRT